MMQKLLLNRRRFLEAASIAAMGAVASPSSLQAFVSVRRRMALVSTLGQASRLRYYAMHHDNWMQIEELSTKAPVAMLLHPSKEVLYVLNEVDTHEDLPRGTVEAYQIGRATGYLKLLCRQPLSLSATRPRHMALSPNGDSLAVAVAGGGAYNLLPILDGGELGRVSSQRKETGSGPLAGHQDSAHPQALVFASGSKFMIASDLGADRLSAFSIENGIELQSRVKLPPGCGPRNLAFHPGGKLLFNDQALAGALSVFHWNGGTLNQWPNQTVSGPFGDALAVHPSGKFLYAAGCGSLTAWSIDASDAALSSATSGCMQRLQTIHAGAINSLVIDPESSRLLASTPRGVVRYEIAAHTGCLGEPFTVASIQHAHSILLL